MRYQVLNHIIKLYGTPTYIFDLDLLTERVNKMKSLSKDTVNLCYAIKANPFLIEKMASLTDRIEVCSPGELSICIQKAIDPNRLLISGVNKTEDYIVSAINYGVTLFSAESLKHIRLLDQASREAQKPIKVFLRLAEKTQFGMDPEDLKQIIQNRKNYEYCDIIGIHYFTGTQHKKIQRHRKEFEKLKRLINDLSIGYGFETKEIEYGPGLYYPYFQNEPEDDLSLFSGLIQALQTADFNCKITIEMGRYFAAQCGTYLTEVNDVKTNQGNNIAILDGGIHQLSYYGSMMGMQLPRFDIIHQTEFQAESDKDWMLCGSLCTTADVIIRNVKLPLLQEGDVIAFKDVGAYSVTEGLSLFLSRALPKVLLIQNNEVISVRDSKETYPLNS